MNVEQFAKELKVAVELLLEQLQAAGVPVKSAKDELSDEDKARLLDYLQSKHGAKQPKTKITLT
ncbi:MAG: translation initiation factor IF-2 N-terminal domain-containing protein, partial [Pseudomonadota bacterium]